MVSESTVLTLGAPPKHLSSQTRLTVSVKLIGTMTSPRISSLGKRRSLSFPRRYLTFGCSVPDANLLNGLGRSVLSDYALKPISHCTEHPPVTLQTSRSLLWSKGKGIYHTKSFFFKSTDTLPDIASVLLIYLVIPTMCSTSTTIP